MDGHSAGNGTIACCGSPLERQRNTATGSDTATPGRRRFRRRIHCINYSSTVAPGAFDFTEAIPPSLPEVLSYISLVPITWPFVAFTSHGSISVTVTHSGSNIGIRVSDTGIGVPGHIISWVNGYGSNGGNAESGDGTEGGLGLMIVLELVQLMNGRAAVSNVPGGGTCFELEIPSLS